VPFGVCCHTSIIGIGCLYKVEHHDGKLTSHCKPDPATHNLACSHVRFCHNTENTCPGFPPLEKYCPATI
jgi:hypothetical protein